MIYPARVQGGDYCQEQDLNRAIQSREWNAKISRQNELKGDNEKDDGRDRPSDLARMLTMPMTGRVTRCLPFAIHAGKFGGKRFGSRGGTVKT